jgi:hypothetical protein
MIDSQEVQRTCDAKHTKGRVERTSTALLVVGVLSTESRAEQLQGTRSLKQKEGM